MMVSQALGCKLQFSSPMMEVTSDVENCRKLLAAAQSMPEPLLNDVLDFAEFLNARPTVRAGDAPSVRLLDLCGGLEGAVSFAGPAASIQRQLRDEWR